MKANRQTQRCCKLWSEMRTIKVSVTNITAVAGWHGRYRTKLHSPHTMPSFSHKMAIVPWWQITVTLLRAVYITCTQTYWSRPPNLNSVTFWDGWTNNSAYMQTSRIYTIWLKCDWLLQFSADIWLICWSTKLNMQLTLEQKQLAIIASWTLVKSLQPSVLWCCWLGGRKGIRPVKNRVVGYWRGYLSGARCRLAYGPADATATHCLLLQ